ncbi:MAG: MerR family transcriptional regulator [Microthrixaceae bacterium]
MTIDGMHQIGEVAETVGLSLRTIRHWDEVALVPPSGRSAGGFRLYTEDDVERLRLVKSLKPLDLSLEQIRDLLDTRHQLQAEPNRAERGRLLQRLAVFSALADERCQRLREQLASVEELADSLRSEVGDQTTAT